MRIAPALIAAVAGLQAVHGRRPAPRPPSETRAVLVAMTAASAAEALEAHRAAAFAAPAVVGFAAELTGVGTGRPFGEYAYSQQLGARVRGVPLLAAAAWAIMGRPAWVAAGWCTARPSRRVPLAAAALTAWDVYLDPRMAAEGYWRWARGGRYEGIPLSNFAGWFATGLAAFTATALLDRAEVGRRDDGALALYVWTWLGEAFANAALWGRPRVAASGALAMGAVAVPALARRAHASGRPSA